MTGIALDALVATGPPPGPMLSIGEGGTSAQTAESAGPLTAEASPFNLLLTLLTTSSPSNAPTGGDETTSETKQDAGADEDTRQPAVETPPAGVSAALASLGLLPLPTLAPSVLAGTGEPVASAAPASLAAVAPGEMSPGAADRAPTVAPAVAPPGSAPFPADLVAESLPFTSPVPAVLSAGTDAAAGGATSAPTQAALVQTSTVGVMDLRSLTPAGGDLPFSGLGKAETPSEDPGDAGTPPATDFPFGIDPEMGVLVREPGRFYRPAEGAAAVMPASGERSGNEPSIDLDTDDVARYDTAPTEGAVPAGPQEAAGRSAPPAAERPAAAERVAEPVRTHLREMPATPGRHEVTLTLSPDSLGELRIRVTTTTNGDVRATVVATTPEAKAALETSAEGLRHTLAERGLRLDGFTVALAPGASDSGATANHTSGGDLRHAAPGGQAFFGGDGQGSHGSAYHSSSGYRPGYGPDGEGGGDTDPASTAHAQGVRPIAPGRVNLLA